MPESQTEHRAGFVNLIGNPNVGKSTLMNQLVGEKLSIITAKAQTTRHRIKGIVDGDNYQIIYSDLPGILTPSYKMQEMMMKFVTLSLQDADVILYLVECGETRYDAEIMEHLQKIDIPIILVINKIDKCTAEQVAEAEAFWKNILPKAESVLISALQSKNIDQLMAKIIEKLPVHEPYFPKDQLTDRSIIIGKGGQAIKKLGTEARLAIEEFIGEHVFLDLSVKVLKDWRNNENIINRFGYGFTER